MPPYVRRIWSDPAVRLLLAMLAASEESVALKGFADPISVVRLTPCFKPLQRHASA
jgi:hypothetical protein